MNENDLNQERKLISGFIRKRREDLKITQEQLAEKTGLGIATIKRFEAGKFWLRLNTFLVICYALDMFFFIAEKDSNEDIAVLMRDRWGKIQNN